MHVFPGLLSPDTLCRLPGTNRQAPLTPAHPRERPLLTWGWLQASAALLPGGVTAVWAPQTRDRPQNKVASPVGGGARGGRPLPAQLLHQGPGRAFESNRAFDKNSRRLQMKYRQLQTNLTPEKERKKQWHGTFSPANGKTASWRRAEEGGLLRAVRDRGSREAVSDAASCPSPPLGPL